MAMTVFRLIGDYIHTVGILVLIHRIFVLKNAQGISRKCQELYLMVFVTRYLDLFTTFYSLYNSFMKVFYIVSSASFVIALKPFLSNHPSLQTYRTDQDELNYWKYAVIPSAVAASILYGSSEFNSMEYLWSFSICLESVATLPQVLMYRKYRALDSLTGGSFIFLMGLYRFCYILNWIVRANTEHNYRHHWNVYICGVVHVAVAFYGYFSPVTSSTTEAESTTSSRTSSTGPSSPATNEEPGDNNCRSEQQSEDDAEDEENATRRRQPRPPVSNTTAPVMPQLVQLYREMSTSTESKRFLIVSFAFLCEVTLFLICHHCYGFLGAITTILVLITMLGGTVSTGWFLLWKHGNPDHRKKVCLVACAAGFLFIFFVNMGLDELVFFCMIGLVFTGVGAGTYAILRGGDRDARLKMTVLGICIFIFLMLLTAVDSGAADIDEALLQAAMYTSLCTIVGATIWFIATTPILVDHDNSSSNAESFRPRTGGSGSTDNEADDTISSLQEPLLGSEESSAPSTKEENLSMASHDSCSRGSTQRGQVEPTMTVTAEVLEEKQHTVPEIQMV